MLVITPDAYNLKTFIDSFSGNYGYQAGMFKEASGATPERLSIAVQPKALENVDRFLAGSEGLLAELKAYGIQAEKGTASFPGDRIIIRTDNFVMPAALKAHFAITDPVERFEDVVDGLAQKHGMKEKDGNFTVVDKKTGNGRKCNGLLADFTAAGLKFSNDSIGSYGPGYRREINREIWHGGYGSLGDYSFVMLMRDYVFQDYGRGDRLNALSARLFRESLRKPLYELDRPAVTVIQPADNVTRIQPRDPEIQPEPQEPAKKGPRAWLSRLTGG
jgi:hypothetical protein